MIVKYKISFKDIYGHNPLEEEETETGYVTNHNNPKDFHCTINVGRPKERYDNEWDELIEYLRLELSEWYTPAGVYVENVSY
jgi:hypothetical protein